MATSAVPRMLPLVPLQLRMDDLRLVASSALRYRQCSDRL